MCRSTAGPRMYQYMHWQVHIQVQLYLFLHLYSYMHDHMQVPLLRVKNMIRRVTFLLIESWWSEDRHTDSHASQSRSGEHNFPYVSTVSR